MITSCDAANWYRPIPLAPPVTMATGFMINPRVAEMPIFRGTKFKSLGNLNILRVKGKTLSPYCKGCVGYALSRVCCAASKYFLIKKSHAKAQIIVEYNQLHFKTDKLFIMLNMQVNFIK